MHSRLLPRILLVVIVLVMLTAWPTPARAQWHGHFYGPGYPIHRTGVFVGVGIGYPGYVYPWFYPWSPYPWRPYGVYAPYGPYFPYGPYGPYGYYGYGRFDDFTAEIRLEVSPRDADVFVDGYPAGKVDEFDGTFQRLRLRPGAHEIAISLNGYHTLREKRYFRPGGNEKMRLTLTPLAPGEAAEAPPEPSTPPPDRQGGGSPPRRYEPSSERAPEIAPARFGTLSLRVVPADAELLVDGVRWPTLSGDESTLIRMSAGRHRIEIQKEGYTRYVEEILIRRDQTLTLNVSLRR
jgi:hypothetical protein